MEEKGISTIVVTPTPEFNREIGFPRIVAVEYPFGRALGQVHDKEGQRQVLLKTLEVLGNVNSPGEVEHLPYEWPEIAKDTHWHPPEISPIAKFYLHQIRNLGAESRKQSK